MFNKETQIKNTNKKDTMTYTNYTMLTAKQQKEKKMVKLTPAEIGEKVKQIAELPTHTMLNGKRYNLNSTQIGHRFNILTSDLPMALNAVGEDYEYATHTYINGNQIAMLSNAGDTYYITQKTKDKLDADLIDITDRRNKSTKNGYTFEHPVPCTVIRDEMAKVDTIQEKNEVLMRLALNVVILSSEEDKTLPRQNMPTNWDGHNVWARYEAAGLQVMDKTVSMHGPIRR